MKTGVIWLVCYEEKQLTLSPFIQKHYVIVTNSLLQSLTGLFAQSLQISRVPTWAHSTSIVGREFFLLDLDFWMVTRHKYGGAGLPTGHAGTFRPTPTLGFGIGNR